MAGWTQYVSVAFAVIGLAQAVFLCLLLRSEGDRAFGANRWMMLFIVTIAFNLIEDVADTFVSGDSEALLDLFFGPINFVIAPAIYLYFREISGNPVRRPWAHFILPLIVLNLMAWATAFGGRTGDGLSDGLSLRGAVDALCWGGIFVQITVYFVLLWHVSCRYFRQTQEQLGADRKSMQRWMGIILGGLTLVFVIVAVGRIVEIYVANSTEMFGTEIAFTLVLFAMSYETATRPVLFVMPDWPSNFEADEFIALDSFTSHGTPDAAKATTLTVPSSPQNASPTTAAPPAAAPTATPIVAPVVNPVLSSSAAASVVEAAAVSLLCEALSVALAVAVPLAEVVLTPSCAACSNSFFVVFIGVFDSEHEVFIISYVPSISLGDSLPTHAADPRMKSLL